MMVEEAPKPGAVPETGGTAPRGKAIVTDVSCFGDRHTLELLQRLELEARALARTSGTDSRPGIHWDQEDLFGPGVPEAMCCEVDATRLLD